MKKIIRNRHHLFLLFSKVTSLIVPKIMHNGHKVPFVGTCHNCLLCISIRCFPPVCMSWCAIDLVATKSYRWPLRGQRLMCIIIYVTLCKTVYKKSSVSICIEQIKFLSLWPFDIHASKFKGQSSSCMLGPGISMSRARSSNFWTSMSRISFRVK